MDILVDIEPEIQTQSTENQIEEDEVARRKRFESLWEHSMSSEEFVRRAHQHIEKVYAARNKQ